MRLGANREPKYTLKSQKVRKISHTITQSLISHCTLSFLVFGPGKKSKEFHSHRVPVKNLIEELKQIAKFPEDIKITSRGDLLEKVLANNPTTKELYLMKEYNYTIILLIKIGSISEFIAFMTNLEVAHKIRLCIPVRYRDSRGYLMAGPVKAFNRVHRQVYYYNNPKHLLEKIRTMVNYMLVYRALQN